MEDKIGFRKKPRIAGPQAALQVVDSGGGSRPGGKAGGQKTGSKSQAGSKSFGGMRVIGGRSKSATPDVADHISRQLKAVYDDVLGQPVPTRFLDLLSKLDNDGGR